MTPRSVLVTGARGFVGRHLMAELGRSFAGAVLHPAEFDVTDPDGAVEAVERLRPDACVHLAAVAAISAARQDPEHAWAVNLGGTLRLARAIRAAAPDCVLVFASSADAYGASFRAGTALDEGAPLAPLNTYGATKAAADLALGAVAAEGLRVVRLRPFNHTGPGQSADFVVPAFARQLARIAAGRQEPVMRVGALDPERDFLDVRDVCAGYAAAIARAESLAPGTILNLASGTPRRVGDVLDGLMTAFRIRPRVETDLARLRATDIPRACGDSLRAREVLGWAPAIPWDRTLRDVAEDWTARVAAEPD